MGGAPALAAWPVTTLRAVACWRGGVYNFFVPKKKTCPPGYAWPERVHKRVGNQCTAPPQGCAPPSKRSKLLKATLTLFPRRESSTLPETRI